MEIMDTLLENNRRFDALYCGASSPDTSCHACVYGRGPHRFTCEKSEEFQQKQAEDAAASELWGEFLIEPMTILDIVNADPKEILVYEGKQKAELFAAIRQDLASQWDQYGAPIEDIIKAKKLVLGPVGCFSRSCDGTNFGYAVGRVWSYA